MSYQFRENIKNNRFKICNYLSYFNNTNYNITIDVLNTNNEINKIETMITYTNNKYIKIYPIYIKDKNVKSISFEIPFDYDYNDYKYEYIINKSPIEDKIYNKEFKFKMFNFYYIEDNNIKYLEYELIYENRKFTIIFNKNINSSIYSELTLLINENNISE